MRKWLSSWWLWLAIPGGSVIAAGIYFYQRGKAKHAAQAAAAAGSSTFNNDPLAAAQQAAQKAVNYASAQAKALRAGGLAGDPLAQALLGLSGEALAPPTAPAEVTANREQAKHLQDEIAGLEASLAKNQAAYSSASHNGGQSPQQEAAIENNLSSQIAADQAALAALGALS